MFFPAGSRSRPRLRIWEPLPYQLSASVSSNNLTIVLSQVAGQAAPWLGFRDATLTHGEPVYRLVQNGTTFTINSGNTLGTANNIPFRVWVVGFDNGSGIVLGVFQSVTGGATPTLVSPLDESTLQSPTGGNGGSSAGTFYAAQALTNRPFRILGCLDWASGLANAGTWSVGPSKPQLFTQGVKLPGDVVQAKIATSTGTTSVSSTTAVQTGLANSITPNAAPNLIAIDVRGGLSTGQNTGFVTGQISRGAGPTLIGGTDSCAAQVAGQVDQTASFFALDAPGSTAATNYFVYIFANASLTTAASWNRLNATTTMTCTEISA